MNDNVTQINKDFGSMYALEHDMHEALKGSWSLFNPHWHLQILQMSKEG